MARLCSDVDFLTVCPPKQFISYVAKQPKTPRGQSTAIFNRIKEQQATGIFNQIKELGYDKVQTIHQAKGLEYPAVIVTDFEIKNTEDINISYVAMTRAKTDLLAANHDAFIKILEKLKHQNLINETNKLF